MQEVFIEKRRGQQMLLSAFSCIELGIDSALKNSLGQPYEN